MPTTPHVRPKYWPPVWITFFLLYVFAESIFILTRLAHPSGLGSNITTSEKVTLQWALLPRQSQSPCLFPSQHCHRLWLRFCQVVQSNALLPSSLSGPRDQMPRWFYLLLIPVPSTSRGSLHMCVRCTGVPVWLCDGATTPNPCWPPALLGDSQRFLSSLLRAYQLILRKLPVGLPQIQAAALLILIAEKILDPHFPPSHSLLSVAESYSPGFYYAYPQIACFSLNRIRCLYTFQEYMR